MEELISKCVQYYQKNDEKINNVPIKEKRKQLTPFIDKFHKESETLTSTIKKKIITLKEDSPILLMTAHQPNLFPYSGVLRKATLLYALGKELEKRLTTPVVTFFGIADQDFTDDRWVKSTILPSIYRKEGKLTLGITLPKKALLKNIPKLPKEKMSHWKEEIYNWINNELSTLNSYFNEKRISDWRSTRSLLENNFNKFWMIVDKSFQLATNYSDFNAFIMSKIINEIWGYDTLFARFSECQQIFSQEYNFLLLNFENYSSSLKEIVKFLSEYDELKGVSDKEPEYLPFWCHCKCGSKARLSYTINNDVIIGSGFCVNCRKEHKINLGKVTNPDVSLITSSLSARAIPMIIIFSKGLGLSCFVGGIGGKDYIKEAQYVAKKLHITLPPIAFWRPLDVYISISKLAALFEFIKISGNYHIYKYQDEIAFLKSKIDDIEKNLAKLELQREGMIEKFKKGDIDKSIFNKNIIDILNIKNNMMKITNLSKIKNDLRMLNNIENLIQTMPSIIDYFINIGFIEINDQWLEHLKNNGSLYSKVHLTSILNNSVINSDTNKLYNNIYKLYSNME